MTEKIGNVVLDYEFYSGSDLYCDGKIEDELLSIVQNNDASDYRKIIEERANWPIFYHLSAMRENIVSWLPFSKSMKVLEVGAGCGAITGALASRVGSVTCIDLSKKRSTINAIRHKDCENVTIKVGNFKDIEASLPNDYDYVCLIGVFEYASLYMGTDHPYEDLMSILYKHLSPEGRLFIAIENKFGMKYWAGCKEDHTGRYFDGIENYQNGGSAQTFTDRGLKKILVNCGINDFDFYYPYPDYKFATEIFSDRRLPKTGELYKNIRNFDRDRFLLFDEQKAYSSVLEEGLFSLYSNSYAVLTGKKPEIIYSKFSNDRADDYAIRTDIYENGDGKKHVEKHPLTPKAHEHIRKIADAYNQLTNKYEGSGLAIDKCEEIQDGVKLDYIQGRTLEERLDECVAAGKKDEFLQLFRRFFSILSYRKQEWVNDWDLIFQNIMLSGAEEDDWTVIDYEWTFRKETDPLKMASRAMHCYILGDPKRAVALSWVREEEPSMLIIDEERILEDEANFQNYVEQGALAACDLRNKIGYRVTSAESLDTALNLKCPRIQIYTDTGKGFSEEESFWIEEVSMDGETVHFNFPIHKDDKKVRIDPGLNSCVVSFCKVMFNQEELSTKLLKAHRSAVSLDEKTTFFANNDPNFVLDVDKLPRNHEGVIDIKMQITVIPEGLSRKMMKKMKFFR